MIHETYLRRGLAREEEATRPKLMAKWSAPRAVVAREPPMLVASASSSRATGRAMAVYETAHESMMGTLVSHDWMSTLPSPTWKQGTPSALLPPKQGGLIH
jgi:hypothetical protein